MFGRKHGSTITLAAVLLTLAVGGTALSGCGQSTTTPATQPTVKPVEQATTTLKLEKDDWYKAELKPVTLQLQLPEGWKTEKAGPVTKLTDEQGAFTKELLPTDFNSRTRLLNKDGKLMAVLGYRGYTPVQGEENNPRAIFSDVTLGAQYHFDVTKPQKSFEGKPNFGLLCKVLRLEGKSGSPESKTEENRGLLVVYPEQKLYVGVEFAPEATESDMDQLAKTLLEQLYH